MRRLFVISRAADLPLLVEDASRSQTVLEQQEKEIAAVEAEIKELLETVPNGKKNVYSS